MGPPAGERGAFLNTPDPGFLSRRADSLRRAGELALAERPFAVVTVVRTEPSTSARTGNRTIVFPDGEMEGWVGGGCIQPTARREGLAALESGEPRLVRITPDTAVSQHNVHLARMTCASEGTADLYVEPFLPRPTLAAAGDSPLASTLATIAPPLGFRFLAVDEAAALNSETVPHPRDTWLVVATFGGFDEDAVEAGLRLNLPYVGLVASERRAETVLSELRNRGFDEEALKVVRSPAGLPLGVRAQEEISLSILAEVVSLRAKLGPREEPDSEPEVAVDPVCGMAVEEAGAQHVVEYGGRDHFFCSPGCRRKFEAEPEKYGPQISA